MRGSQALYTRHQADPEADCLLQIRRRRHGRICEEGKDLWDWVINPTEVVITYPSLLACKALMCQDVFEKFVVWKF